MKTGMDERMTRPANQPSTPDAGQQTTVLQGAGGRMPWRTAGISLTSLGTPIGIGIAAPLYGQVMAAIEVAVVLTIIGTALFGSQALSERAFRLLRWIGNRAEPPAPAAAVPAPPVTSTMSRPPNDER
jgi:hypothetical protein